MKKKNTPGGCCCCKHIWTGTTLYNVKGEKESPEIINNNGFTLGDYDPVSRIAFATRQGSGTPLSIAKYIEQSQALTSPLFTGVTSSRSILAQTLAADPAGSHVFYTYHVTGSTNNFIKRINYDGSTDTSISTETGNTTTLPAIKHLVYHRNLDRVYFVLLGKNGSSVDTWFVRYINADGTGGTAVFDTPYNSAQNDIRELEIDYINEKLWFMHVERVSSVTTRYIKRCDYDGSNLETVYTLSSPLNFCSGIQVSYKDQCLYTYDYNITVGNASDPDGGFFKRDFSYTQIGPRLMARKESDTIFSSFRLGCGFEVLGEQNEG